MSRQRFFALGMCRTWRKDSSLDRVHGLVVCGLLLPFISIVNSFDIIWSLAIRIKRVSTPYWGELLREFHRTGLELISIANRQTTTGRKFLPVRPD